MTVGAPSVLTLRRLGPNPFTGATTLGLTVATAAPVRVDVLDVLGRTVATLHDGAATPGALLRLALDGAALAPGLYLARAVQDGRAATLAVTKAR